jgi:hypothetical protein
VKDIRTIAITAMQKADANFQAPMMRHPDVFQTTGNNQVIFNDSFGKDLIPSFGGMDNAENVKQVFQQQVNMYVPRNNFVNNLTQIKKINVNNNNLLFLF